MLGNLLAMLGNSNPLPPGGVPSVSTASVSAEDTGLCSGGNQVSSASVRVSWTLAGTYDPDQWDVVVSGDGAFHPVTQRVSQLAQSSVEVPLGTWVEDGQVDRQSLDLVFTVKVVPHGEDRVLDSKATSTWARNYGRCS